MWLIIVVLAIFGILCLIGLIDSMAEKARSREMLRESEVKCPKCEIGTMNSYSGGDDVWTETGKLCSNPKCRYKIVESVERTPYANTGGRDVFY